jgi:hypothetical protein
VASAIPFVRTIACDHAEEPRDHANPRHPDARDRSVVTGCRVRRADGQPIAVTTGATESAVACE